MAAPLIGAVQDARFGRFTQPGERSEHERESSRLVLIKRAWFRESPWGRPQTRSVPGNLGLPDFSHTGASQLDPLWKHPGPPHYRARLGYQNEARAVSGIVVEARNVRQLKRARGVGDTPGVAASHVGIRNKMSAPLRPVQYARDTSFRSVHGNKDQLDRVPSGFGSAQQIHPAPAGESRLDGETHALIEVCRRAIENAPCGGDGCIGRIQGVQSDGDCVGIEQPVAALEIDRSRERRLPGAVRACDYREWAPCLRPRAPSIRG
jgi:hypothetical protein